jgi:hypothetical protein
METLLIIGKIAMGCLAAAGVAGAALASLWRNNRLLFWCLVGALVGHLGVATIVYAAGKLIKERPPEMRVNITVLPAPPPPKEQPLPKPPDPKQMDVPFGRMDGKRDVTKIKKGTSLKAKTAGAQGKKVFGNQRVMAQNNLGGVGDVAYDPDAKGEILGPGDSLDVKDLNNIGTVGGNGDDWGVEDGDPDGGIPLGFENGKKGGKVYFVRLKHGAGAWLNHNEGTKRLLSFLDKTVPCQTDTWPMSTAELRDRYMAKGKQPSFIYIYCDETFALTSADVLVLRDYMAKDGFLFIDSTPLPEIRERVTRELDKVLPGMGLRAIPNSHPINSYLYRIDRPAFGMNLIDQKNFGVMKSGRLVAFYTPGNYGFFFTMNPPGSDDFSTATYQMASNVMVYAITKGNPSGVVQKAGASAKITKQAIERLFQMSASRATPATGGGDPDAPPPSVKVKPVPTTSDNPSNGPPAEEPEPDEIQLMDED